MVENNDDGRGTPPSHIHVGGEAAAKKTNWLPWILAGLGLLALLFLLSQCDRKGDRAAVAPVGENVVVTEESVVTDEAAVAGADSATATALAGTSGLGAYLAGTEALPRTFVFEKMYFDTAKSEMRADSRDEVNAVATALKQNANARIRVVGFADARGDAAANAALGAARANSVKSALVAQGIDAGRIDTASGGETSPSDSNATAAGQAGNRRTELVALTR